MLKTDCSWFTKRSHPPARAFSLVELVISMGIMSVLAAGISSAIVISLRSVETSNSQSTRLRQAADLSQQLAAELSGALDVSERSPTAVAFSVPDRDNDGNSEELRYSWSGTPGHPVLRQYNFGTAVPVLQKASFFGLAYELVPVPLAATGADLMLAGHHAAKDLVNYRVRGSEWASQSFQVDLPSGTSWWKITRVVLFCKQFGDSGGQVTVQLRSTLSDGRPGSYVYCQSTVLESGLPKEHGWYGVSMKYSNYLSSNNRYCVVITGNVNDVCELRAHGKNVLDPGYVLSTTTNSGSSWSIRLKQSLLFDVYGLPYGGGSANTEMRLGTIRWEVQAGPDVMSRVYGGAQLVNCPE